MVNGSFHSRSDHFSDPPLAPVLDPAGRIPDDIDARLAALALRAQAGDLPARNALFLAIWPRCAPVLNGIRRNYVWRELEGRAWTFDDLDQEAFPVFCEIVDRWSGLEPRFAGYFFTRFRWRMFDVLRSWSVSPRREEALIADLPVSKDETDAIELRLVVEALFAHLATDERQLLEWRLIDGRTDAEMAQTLGVSVKTVRRRRIRVFAKARDHAAAIGWRADSAGLE